MGKNTGGPAFPTDAQEALKHDHYEGMTLRDYFAAKALPIAWDSFDKGYFETDEPNKEIAKCAYQIADSMLAERDR